MPTSVQEIIDLNQAKVDDLTRALKAYPDLRTYGVHVESPSLKIEDCDTIVVKEYDEGPGRTSPRLMVGKQFGSVVVLADTTPNYLSSLLYQLKRKDFAFYKQLIKAIVDS